MSAVLPDIDKLAEVLDNMEHLPRSTLMQAGRAYLELLSACATLRGSTLKFPVSGASPNVGAFRAALETFHKHLNGAKL